jgi:hypothetical protein
MHLGSLTSWLAELENRAGEFANKTEAYIVNTLVKFRDKRGELNFQINKLRSNPPLAGSPAILTAQYSAALQQATDAKTKADWVGKIADAFTNVTGLGAIQVIAGVPVAVLVAAAVSATYIITQVTKSVTTYMNARQIGETAMREGKDATGAVARYLEGAAQSGGLFGDAAKLVWPIAIVGGIVLYMNSKGRK